MTTRLWAFLIALVGLILFARSTRERQVYFQKRASDHTKAEKMFKQSVEIHRMMVEQWERSEPTSERLPSLNFQSPLTSLRASEFQTLHNQSQRNAQRSLLSRYQIAAAYSTALREKYERAAKFPWLPIEPDPPSPE